MPFYLLALLLAPAQAVDWSRTPAARVPPDAAGLELDARARDWLAALPGDDDRRRAAKGLSLGGVPYAWLSKRDGRYFLEGAAVIETPLAEAWPKIRDAAAYPEWAFSDINKRRGAGGAFWVVLEPLKVEARRRLFLARYRLTRFFKGPRRLWLNYRFDETPVRRLRLSTPAPTRLVKGIAGELRFYPLPGDASFLLYFTAVAQTHWALYYLVPQGLVRIDAEERVLTVFENAARRAAS